MNIVARQSQLQRRWYKDARPLIYVVVENKIDGGDTRKNSMRALSVMAVGEDYRKLTVFNVNLLALEGTAGDPRTLALAREHPEAWRITTVDAQRSSIGIPAFTKWVQSLPGQPVLVASPLTLNDLARALSPSLHSTQCLPRSFQNKAPFFEPGIDLSTLVMGVTGRHYRQTAAQLIPPEWHWNRNETHTVIGFESGAKDILSLYEQTAI